MNKSEKILGNYNYLSNENSRNYPISPSKGVGELVIRVLDPSKTKKVFEYKSGHFLPGILAERSKNELKKHLEPENGKKKKSRTKIGSINIKILENHLGKRSFDLTFDTLINSSINSKQKMNTSEFKSKTDLI